MIGKPLFSIPLFLCVLCAAGLGQSFSYPDFSSTVGLTLNGTSAQAGSVLRLTQATTNQAGSFFYDTPTQVTQGFVCTFSFQIQQVSSTGADGFAFVIHNDSAGLQALGDSGSGLGYALNGNQSIQNSIAIEFDTWDSGMGDPNNNHVSIHTGSTGDNQYSEDFSLGNAKVSADMRDGLPHIARIVYDGVSLTVFVDDLQNPLLNVAWDFQNGGTYQSGKSVGGLKLIGTDSAYLGFTGGTGGVFEEHDIVSWDWTGGDGPVGSPYCGPANLNSTGNSAQISGWGQLLVSANSLALTATLMPPGEVGYFLCSLNGGFVPNPGGSLGNLCLGSGIGRFVKQVQVSDTAGTFSIPVDLTALPVWRKRAAQAGETWRFQAWFKDGPSSNFTDGLSVTFF